MAAIEIIVRRKGIVSFTPEAKDPSRFETAMGRVKTTVGRFLNPPLEVHHQTRAEMDPRLRDKLDDLARQISSHVRE